LKANTGYDLRISSLQDGTHGGGKEYQKGVKFKGVPGKRGSYVKITVANDAPDKLYLYSKSQQGMAINCVLLVED
jgi:hypothetical protein